MLLNDSARAAPFECLRMKRLVFSTLKPPHGEVVRLSNRRTMLLNGKARSTPQNEKSDPKVARFRRHEEKAPFGAAKRTRTSTPVTGLAPQASASTNSAMAALERAANRSVVEGR